MNSQRCTSCLKAPAQYLYALDDAAYCARCAREARAADAGRRHGAQRLLAAVLEELRLAGLSDEEIRTVVDHFLAAEDPVDRADDALVAAARTSFDSDDRFVAL